MTRNDEARDPAPSLVWFATKLVLVAAWVGAGGLAAATLLHGGTRPTAIAAALFLVTPPVIWLLAKAVALKRADEVRAYAMLRGLAQGLLFACVLPGAMIGGGALSSLFLGAGAVNVSGMMQNAVVYIALLPPLAFFMSELSAFALLSLYARKPDR